MYKCVHLFPYSALLWRPGNSNTPVAVSTLSDQILDYKYHSLLVEPGILGEMVDSSFGTEKVQDELEKSYARK